MIDVRITKRDPDYILLTWEENGEFGNLKIEYTNDCNYKIDAECIGMDRLLRILSNIK